MDNTRWRWIKLGSTQTLSGTSYTLKLYQGSAGYSVDKIVFTNDSFGSTPASGGTWSIPAVLLRTLSGGTASSDGGTLPLPPASPVQPHGKPAICATRLMASKLARANVAVD
ncbi:MAG: hypothetical protein U0401_02845 [Anaerolineae bacterium]